MQHVVHLNRATKVIKRLTLTSCLLLILANMAIAEGLKCHTCLFNLAHCTNPLDCYNQPDTCTNINFSPVYSKIEDCEFGCEQYVITDATGSTIKWHRGCATPGSPKSSYICFSRNIYFMRHEQCWCHYDYCNTAAREISGGIYLLIASIIATYISRILLNN